MDNVDCGSNVDSLDSCSYTSYQGLHPSPHSRCSHSQDVLLDCYQARSLRRTVIKGDSGEIRLQTYGNDAYFAWLMAPTCNTVKLISSEFDTEPNKDYVEIAGAVFRFSCYTRTEFFPTHFTLYFSLKYFVNTKCTSYIWIL